MRTQSKAYRESVIGDALIAAAKTSHLLQTAERQNDPAWQRVESDTTYQWLKKRVAAGCEKLPEAMALNRKLIQPSVVKSWHRMLMIEANYGAVRTAGVDLADTRERFAEWIDHRGRVLWMMSDNNPVFLQMAFERATDLRVSLEISQGPRPPTADDESSYAKGVNYLEDLKYWGLGTSAVPPSQTTLPYPKPKGRPRKQNIEKKIREAIAQLRKSGLADEQITRDMIVTKSGVSAGKVSDSVPWGALKGLKSQAKAKDARPSETTPSNAEEAIERGDWEAYAKVQKAEEKQQYRFDKSPRHKLPS
jgi:hypothetical protein